MQQHSCSCKGRGFSSILRILWIPNVYYRIHNSPPTVSTLSQINAVHVLHYISVRPILILCSHLSQGPPSVLFLPGFPTKTPLSLYVPHSPPISSSSDYHSTILRELQITKLLAMQFSPFSVVSSLLRPSVFLSTFTSNTLTLSSPLNATDQVLPLTKQRAQLQFCLAYLRWQAV